MHNLPSPATTAYLYRTPEAASHAHHTPLAFSLGFPPHVFLPQRLPTCVPAPPVVAQSGYPYPSSASLAPHAAYHTHPVYLHKAPPATAPAEPEPHDPMAISLPYFTRPHPASSTDSGSHRDDSGSGSDGGRDNTPPEDQQRAKDAKKKIHHCWMCHKSFDRPSTLKKHLLVHTGEKAFACESCGRRFGVASNLNRHAKTCRAANPGASATTPAADSSSPAASASQAAAASPSTSSDPGAAPVASTSAPAPHTAIVETPVAPVATPAPRRSVRKRKAASAEENMPEVSSAAEPRQSRSRKRARRAPSPSLWVPDSLKAFDLTPLAKGTPVPLPPVRPFRESNQCVEERDSFDENASANPYHPRGWGGRLPGPGLMGTNVANRSGGQLLIF